MGSFFEFLAQQPLRIHMIGICGVGMSALAGMLVEKGYIVSGSDAEVYPPISTLLENMQIKIFKGFSSDTIKVVSPHIAIIGNAISRGNPELEVILEKRIPYLSMAQALYYFFLWDREIIGIAGTHGKTTTTALLAHILNEAGMQPSFFVGGIPKNYKRNYHIGEGKYFVIEADEYDSAFFEKIPKFIVYRPHHCIMTSLEFDHADIYNNINEIVTWFKRLQNIIPKNGHIVANGEYEILKEVIKASSGNYLFYGKGNCDVKYKYENGYLIIDVGSKVIKFIPKIYGDFNYQNITAAVTMALTLGVSAEAIQYAVESFTGVKRRQEILFENEYLTIIEDFAHHPTAIQSVLHAVSERYPQSYIIAVYEPRSATSRRNVLQDQLSNSFKDADCVIIKTPYRLDKVPVSEQIDIQKVVNDIQCQSKYACLLDNIYDIVEEVFSHVGNRHTVVVVMSNGSFDGIYELLVKKAREKFNNE